MSTITIAMPAAFAGETQTEPAFGLFARMLAAIIAGRTRTAERAVARHLAMMGRSKDTLPG